MADSEVREQIITLKIRNDISEAPPDRWDWNELLDINSVIGESVEVVQWTFEGIVRVNDD